MRRAAYHPPVSQATEHVDGEALARSLADLNLPDSDDIDVQGGIARVVRGAAGVFAGSGVGLMLIAEDGHSLRYVASSDEVARAARARARAVRARAPAWMRSSSTRA